MIRTIGSNIFFEIAFFFPITGVFCEYSSYVDFGGKARFSK